MLEGSVSIGGGGEAAIHWEVNVAECTGDHEFAKLDIETAPSLPPNYHGMILYCQACGVGYLIEMRPESVANPTSKARRVYVRMFPSGDDLFPSQIFMDFAAMNVEMMLVEMESAGYTVSARGPHSGDYARARLERINGAPETWTCSECEHARSDHEMFDQECLTCDCRAMV